MLYPIEPWVQTAFILYQKTEKSINNCYPNMLYVISIIIAPPARQQRNQFRNLCEMRLPDLGLPNYIYPIPQMNFVQEPRQKQVCHQCIFLHFLIYHH